MEIRFPTSARADRSESIAFRFEPDMQVGAIKRGLFWRDAVG